MSEQLPQPQPSEGDPSLLDRPDLAGYDAYRRPTTSHLRDLITPDLIARANSVICLAPLRKYAEVINSQYTVKLGRGVTNYEYRVLQFLDTIPHVATPRPIDFFDINVSVKQPGEAIVNMEVWHVLIMSTIPGEHLGDAGQGMKPDEMVDILEKVRVCMDRINSFIESGAMFPDPEGSWIRLLPTTDCVSNLDGDRGQCIQLPLYNGILPGSIPFNDFVPTMSQTARQPPDTAELLTNILTYLGPAQSSDVRFCHMDLHIGNVMVHGVTSSVSCRALLIGNVQDGTHGVLRC